jgi:hypothetical protein
MKLSRFLPLLFLGACSSPQTDIPLEAPNVKFKKAAILAAVAPQHREEVENLVAAELERRRPESQAVATYGPLPDLDELTGQGLLNYLNYHSIDLLVTIVPFAETLSASYQWEDVASDEIGIYVEDLTPYVLAGRYGVQVVGWDVSSREPVYAKTSAIMVGETTGPAGVADFAATTVTRDI